MRLGIDDEVGRVGRLHAQPQALGELLEGFRWCLDEDKT